MPDKDNKVLKVHGEKSLKAPAIIYTDLSILIWCNKKETWLLQRRRLYGKVL